MEEEEEEEGEGETNRCFWLKRLRKQQEMQRTSIHQLPKEQPNLAIVKSWRHKQRNHLHQHWLKSIKDFKTKESYGPALPVACQLVHTRDWQQTFKSRSRVDYHVSLAVSRWRTERISYSRKHEGGKGV